MKRRRRRIEWIRLDNASKIFPATANHKDTKVFRMFCDLNEKVDSSKLQDALDRTLIAFPLYRSVLRRGVFWYYFEKTDMEALVTAEHERLYSPLYIKGEKMLPFRVHYHENRINVEIFHALSDGTGAFWFVQTLIYNYLIFKHPEHFEDSAPHLGMESSQSQRFDDSFDRHFRYRSGRNEEQVLAKDEHESIDQSSSKEKLLPNVRTKAQERALKRHAYRIPGKQNELGLASLIEGELSVSKVLELSRSFNTTLTVFITAVYLLSIYQDMPHQKKLRPVVIEVPVNLRQFYSSETARNFFSLIKVKHVRQSIHETPTLEECIDFVQRCFAEELTEERLLNRIMNFMKLERFPLVRIVPTSIKDIILRISHWISDFGSTASISNMGRVKMPDEMMPYIHHFGVSTAVRRPQICACSTGDRLILSFSSPIQENEVTRRFFNFFTERGIKISINSNISVLPNREALVSHASLGISGSSEVARRGSLPLVPKEDEDKILTKGDES